MRRGLFLIVVVISLLLSKNGEAQEAVPVELLGRTVPIQGPTEQGTAFAIDYEGKLYEITARHVMAGVVQDHPTNVKIRRDGEWLTLPVIRVLYPASPNVDIAILETTFPSTKPFEVEPSPGPGSMAMGQNVWFLGFPFGEGLGSKFANGKTIPFIKRGTLSAVDASVPHAEVLYIDGFNNPGFSGGPIVYYDLTLHKYFIAGVVKGYRNDTAKALVNGEQVETNVLVNSGILVAYDISEAMSAIKAAPPVK